MPDPSAPQTPTSALVQVPTDSHAAVGQGEFLARNVPAAPLPAGSPQLNVLRDRAASFREQQAAYLKQFADGVVTPFPEIAEARPRHEAEVAALARSLATISREADPLKRETGSKALFAALQPIGPLLKHAEYVVGYQNILTAAQVAEYQRLESAWEGAAVNHPPNTQPLSAVGPSQLYTLTHLSVPLVAKGAPDSTILFRAQAGGLFSNNLPIIEKTTDENGIAIAYWSTRGDAIADCRIDVLSPSAPTDGASFNIITVKLELAALPGIAVAAP